MSKTHSFELEDKTIEILGILSRRTKRNESELLEEALAYLFEEYKEIIFDTEAKNDEEIETKFGPGSKGVSDG